MNYRIKIGSFVKNLGNFLTRVAYFIGSLAVVIMKPDDLMKLTRQNYDKPEVQEKWAREDYLSKGLFLAEINLLAKVPLNKGRLFLICLGAGREAVALAKMGFEVVGVDFIPEMVAKAKKYADSQGVKIEALVQEMMHLEVPRASFDLVWCTNEIYSFIPTRAKRLSLLATIADTLKPEGYFLCSFVLSTRTKRNPLPEYLRKALAVATGNRWYEAGDFFTQDEFLHTFLSVDEIEAEFNLGGFEVLYFDKAGNAILRKRGTNLQLIS
jgi:2-polyprenyl-3-methyl-5-hydroxy-6-metoxy-1,4-benzoquinol methylase